MGGFKVYYILIYLPIFIRSNTSNEQCLRKQGYYHDTKLKQQDENVNSRSSLTFKYLQLAKQKEASILLNNFNWTKIKEDVTYDFRNICAKNTSYYFNYTISLKVQIEDNVVPTPTPQDVTETFYSTLFTTISYGSSLSMPIIIEPLNSTANAISLLLTITSLNLTELYAYLSSSNGTITPIFENNTSDIQSPWVDVYTSNFSGEVPYASFKNISVEKIKFNVTTFVNYTTLDITLLNMGTTENGTTSSSDVIRNITKLLDTVSKYISTKNISVTNNCNSSSMDLMSRVTRIPLSFNQTVTEIGLRKSNETMHFYYCNMKDEQNCMNLLSLTSIVAKSVTQTIVGTHKVTRRSVPFSSSEELDCMLYTDHSYHKECKEPKRTKRSDDKPKLPKDLNEELKKVFRLGKLVPPGATHVQTDISGASSSGVVGIGDIQRKTKNIIKDTLRNQLPNIPSASSSEQLYSVINKPRPQPPPQHAKPSLLTSSLQNIGRQKLFNLQSVLDDQPGTSQQSASRGAVSSLPSGGPPRATTSTITFPGGTPVNPDETMQQIRRMSGYEGSNWEYHMPDSPNVLTKRSEYVHKKKLALEGIHGKGPMNIKTSSSTIPASIPGVDTKAVIYKPAPKAPPPPRPGTLDPIYITGVNQHFTGPMRPLPPRTPVPLRPLPPQTPRPFPVGPQPQYMEVNFRNHPIQPIIPRYGGGAAVRPLPPLPQQQPMPPVISPYAQYAQPAQYPQAPPVISPYAQPAQPVQPIYAPQYPMQMGPYAPQYPFRPYPQYPPASPVYTEPDTTAFFKSNPLYQQLNQDFLARNAPPLPPRNPPQAPPRNAPPLPPRNAPRGQGNPGAPSINTPATARRCRRDLTGIVCGMLGSSRTQPRAQAPPAAGASSNPMYSEIGKIPARGMTFKQGKSASFNSKLGKLGVKFDKSMMFAASMMLASQQAASQQMRSMKLQEREGKEKPELIFEAVLMGLQTIGNSLSSAGMAAGPKVMAAGMAISVITGLIEAAKDIYYLIEGRPKQDDPVLTVFNQYYNIILDNTKSGVRKCLMPGDDLKIYMAYRNDSSFKLPMEKTQLFFLDVIGSEVVYLTTPNLLMEYSLKVVCNIGVLRSPDLDITAYTSHEVVSDMNVYSFTRLHVMLSRFPVVRLTCGKDISLTLRPFVVPIEDMQLVKIATPGEPKETMELPSNVCDIYPFKSFYLMTQGCPFDSSRIAIVQTTCNILLRLSTWDSGRSRWILKSPFKQSGDYHQLFTFSKYDFNDTILNPNMNSDHAKLCANSQSNICYWGESMLLEDTMSCESRIRKLYIKLNLFGQNGFNSIVLTCPSGATPVHVGNTNSLVELPVSDYGASKLYGSTEKGQVAIFCQHNYDEHRRSDILVLIFENTTFAGYNYILDRHADQERLFKLATRYMPYRSWACLSTSSCKWRVTRMEPSIKMFTNYFGERIILRETYTTFSISPQNIKKSKTHFPAPMEVNIPVPRLGDAYKNPNHFWENAKKGARTYSAIIVLMYSCTARYNLLQLNSSSMNVISYRQSVDQDYGNGKYYEFSAVTSNPSNCVVKLNLETRTVEIRCPEFSIPRNVADKEGLCFLVATSKDHCATNTDWLVSHGYNRKYAYSSTSTCNGMDYYCGYIGNLKNYYPDYDMCSAVMYLEYRNIWIENQVLSPPPYKFEAKYDSNHNEYLDKGLSDHLKKLYNSYERLANYSDGSLPASINRLAGALTNQGRDITEVIVNSDILEIAYLADQEKLAEIEAEIQEVTQELFLSTLTDEDIKAILEAQENERCCLLNIAANTTRKFYPLDHYSCGTVDDYVYEDQFNELFVLVNDSLISYDTLYQTKMQVKTCFQAVIIPLDTKQARDEVEEAILSTALVEGINEILDELDVNVSMILIADSLKAEAHNTAVIVASTIICIVAMIFISALTYKLYVHQKCQSYSPFASMGYKVTSSGGGYENCSLENVGADKEVQPPAESKPSDDKTDSVESVRSSNYYE